MPEISVIVPIYNVNKYIRKCLDSILAQTFSDIEIICVDDGSDDGSEKVVDEYAAKDGRIVSIHKRNAGYGAALNTGLDVATGTYIGIVESDDCILPQMYERLHEHAKSGELEVVKSGAFYWYENLNYKKKIPIGGLNEYCGKVLDGTYRNVFFDFYMNIWTGIYRRDFLISNDIRFNESPGASYQDNGFWMQTMMYAKRAIWIDEAYYLYRQDNPDASIKSAGKVYAMENEYAWLEDRIKNRGQYYLLPYCYYYRMVRNRGVFYRIADEYKMEYATHLEDEYRKYGSAVKNNLFLDRWMRTIVNNKESQLSEILEKKSYVLSKLESVSSIIIYGAGNRGIIALRNLVNLNEVHKVKCFAVTSDIKEPVIASRCVLRIEDAIQQYSESLVIVATVRGTNAYKDMCVKLLELGVNNYIEGSLFEEYFYLV